MDLTTTTIDQVIVVAIAGEIDGKTAPEVQQQILTLVQPDGKILLDLSRVEFMSSAGLRMLLATYRQVSGQKAAVGLVGLSEELQDTMAATGFLNFFTTYDTVEAGLLALSN